MIDIRPATMEDFDIYYKIKCQQTDIVWTGPFINAPQRDVLIKSFENRIQTNYETGSKRLFVIVDAEIVKGYIVFTVNADDVEIGFSVYEPYQKHGIGKKAMELAVKKAIAIRPKVFVQIRDDNYPSQRCCLSAGFIATEEYFEVEYPTIGKSKMRKYIIEKDV